MRLLAGRRAGRTFLRLAGRMGDAEVHDHRLAVGVDHDVRRLQVAMDDAGRVGGDETGHDAARHAHDLGSLRLVTRLEARREVVPLDVGGDYACVEWTVGMTHTGTIALADDRRVEPTGVRVAVHGVTVAEFDGDRICSVRQYWDENAVFDQLGVLAAGSPAPTGTGG